MSTINKVADQVILLHREVFGESVSPMKLQKLCYYAEGFYLASREEGQLFPEVFQAWVHGPVCPELYQRFRQYGWKAIPDDIVDPRLDTELVAHIKNVVEAYGSFDGAALSRMTHQELPWKEARGGIPELQNCDKQISKDTMKRYFKRVLETQQA